MNDVPADAPQVGKIAMRQEGQWWVAYLDLQHENRPKVELARIHMDAMRINPDRREQFLTLARDLVADLIERATGIRPIFGAPTPGPEAERAGRA